MRLIGAIFAGLLGLAFGSFLNVCLSRWPEGESVVAPRSHCRHCTHTLAWWENLPVLSWIILRSRCRQCRTGIGIRYPLVELAVGLLWTCLWLQFPISDTPYGTAYRLALILGFALLSLVLIGLASLDAEFFWLPDLVTLPGIALGILFRATESWLQWRSPNAFDIARPSYVSLWSGFAWNEARDILIAASLVLVIRLAYWLVRRKEGMGLGDAKLMALLAAWLGLPAALESFALAILGATAAAILWLIVAAIRRNIKGWATMPLPLGTFLCLAALTEIFFPGWLWNWWYAKYFP